MRVFCPSQHPLLSLPSPLLVGSPAAAWSQATTAPRPPNIVLIVAGDRQFAAGNAAHARWLPTINRPAVETTSGSKKKAEAAKQI